MTTGPATAAIDATRPRTPVVYLVDDDPSLLRALSRWLRAADLQVEAFESSEAFLHSHRSRMPACAVLDLQMPGPGGLQVQQVLADEEEPLPVVFLTAHGDVPSSVRAMKGGAVDFLTKPVRGGELIEAVHRALARGTAERETRDRQRLWRERYATLTPTERRVFAFLVRGLPNKGIADEIGTCERTVKAHRAEVMRKMHVQAPAELGRAVEWLGETFDTVA